MPPRRKSSYKRRERDFDYMGWVKQQPCAAATLSACEGPVEADHAGRRGVGQKADDSTCIPLCSSHHRQRTDFSGVFRDWDRERMRYWLIGEIASANTRYAARDACPF